MPSGFPFSTWVLVEEKVVTITSIGSYDFTPTLNGNVDNAYIIECFLKNDNTNTAFYNLRINQADMGGTRQTLSASSTTLAGDKTGSIWFAQANTNEATGGVLTIIKANTGDIRPMHGTFTQNGSSNISALITVFDITTPVNSINITNLGVSANVVSGLGVNTMMRLWKIG